MMKKHFVNYNQSLALKELDFNEECLAYFNSKGILSTKSDEYELYLINNDKWISPACSAPLKSQVFEWFREYYNKLSAIDHSSVNGWYFVIREIGGTTDPWLKALSVGSFKTYEEAESACIYKLIEIVKDGR